MGPKPRDYFYRPPKKVRRGALRAALSLRAREKALIIVDGFKLDAAKTQAGLRGAHQAAEAARTRWSSTSKDNTNLHRSVRNLAKFDVLPPEGLNLESVLRHKQPGADLRRREGARGGRSS